MAAIQLSLPQILRHEIVEEIRKLSEEQKRNRHTRNTIKKDLEYSEKTHSDYSKQYKFFWQNDVERRDRRLNLRILHLANNFLKGNKYREVEKNVSEDSTWSFYFIEGLVFHCIEKYVLNTYTREDVRKWLRER